MDLAKHPFIAACSGGFQVPGLLSELQPTCGQTGGDDGPNPTGIGCSAWDLCASGWHVCKTAAEVQQLSPGGCGDAAPGGDSLFFATRQSGPGCGDTLATRVARNLPQGVDIGDDVDIDANLVRDDRGLWHLELEIVRGDP